MAESTAVKQKSTSYADRLESALNRMVNEQFASPEFRFIAETPLTMARAKFYTLQMVFYAANRRDCWAYVQARAPLDVKQAIWHHEQDELIVDPRGGTDHMTLMSREAVALGVTGEELAASQPTPLVKAALMAFCYNASTLPWLAGLVQSHFLERRNNNNVIKSGAGGSSLRWRDRLIKELGVDPKGLTSSNVHVVADQEHSDLIWEAIARHVTDEDSYKTAWQGAREAAQLDRAVRAALAMGMRMIDAERGEA